MDTQMLLLLVVLFSNVILVIVVAVIGLSFGNLLKKLRLIEKENTYLKNQMQGRALHLIQEARDNAVHILEDAHVKAQRIIQSAKDYEAGLDKRIDTQLDTTSHHYKEVFDKTNQELLKTYEEMLRRLKEDNVNLLQNVSKDIEKEVMTEVKDFTGIMAKGTLDTQKEVEAKINASFAKVQSELETYKTDQYRKLDEQIYTIIQMTVSQVLGRTLRMEDHQQLVLDALKEAKTSVMFRGITATPPAPQPTDPKPAEQAAQPQVEQAAPANNQPAGNQ
jgi:vacuolar-type H+-ATPase subunit H